MQVTAHDGDRCRLYEGDSFRRQNLRCAVVERRDNLCASDPTLPGPAADVFRREEIARPGRINLHERAQADARPARKWLCDAKEDYLKDIETYLSWGNVAGHRLAWLDL